MAFRCLFAGSIFNPPPNTSCCFCWGKAYKASATRAGQVGGVEGVINPPFFVPFVFAGHFGNN